jgi:hypothetical protein
MRQMRQSRAGGNFLQTRRRIGYEGVLDAAKAAAMKGYTPLLHESYFPQGKDDRKLLW